MSRYVELTPVPGTKVLATPEDISITPAGEGGTVLMVGGVSMKVQETPDEIRTKMAAARRARQN